MPSAKSQSTKHGPSFLRWAGSKRNSLNQLALAYDELDRRYIEPFAGSAALFFHSKPPQGVLADLNGHLVNAMRKMRDCPKELHSAVQKLRRDKETYYEIRDKFNTFRPFGFEAAVYFIYLNRNCFNGLWRTNFSGKFNVPFGGSKIGSNPPLELYEECAKSLRSVSLRHQDFRVTLSDLEGHAFVYADPPYFTSTERTFVEYGKKSFGEKDLAELIGLLRNASSKGVKVALTYKENISLPGLPPSWFKKRIEVTRNVGGFSDSRRRQCEVLYTNYRVSA